MFLLFILLSISKKLEYFCSFVSDYGTTIKKNALQQTGGLATIGV
jgi:hypothetical protein